MRLALHEHPEGVETEPGPRVVYDVERNEARFGAARVDGPALVWELVGDPGPGAWVLRCDRVDFPPAGVAHRHVHPGPGLRRLLRGELTIDRDGDRHTYRAGEWWYEDADDPVLATASASEETAFVRVLLLPAEWAGKRTIRYLDPADEAKPKLQRATVLLEQPLSL
ncbi:MAG: cupin domain-containing protein [Gaiellaceae bacterium]